MVTKAYIISETLSLATESLEELEPLAVKILRLLAYRWKEANDSFILL